MNEDLISGDFSRNIDLKKVSTNINLIKVVLIIGGVTTTIFVLRWIMMIYNNNILFNSMATDNLRIYFAVTFLCRISYVALFVISWINYLKSNKLIKQSVIENNADIFNKAFRLINTTTKLTIVGYSITLIEIIISFSFKIK